MYSLQGKGRGRRRRNAAEGKDFSLKESSVDPAKRSTADKAQQKQTPPSADMTKQVDNTTSDLNTSFLPIDELTNDFPTSGLMQSDLLPGFDGQSIDDYLDSSYMSTLPGQHDFDPNFYFGNNCESFDSTPIDSLSGMEVRHRPMNDH